MPVPKRKLSRSRRNMRSANKHIIPQPFSLCKTENCNTPLLGHTVCMGCGMYKGKQIVKMKAKKTVVAKTAQ
jgi:large subunit ribosomal protein L32